MAFFYDSDDDRSCQWPDFVDMDNLEGFGGPAAAHLFADVDMENLLFDGYDDFDAWEDGQDYDDYDDFSDDPGCDLDGDHNKIFVTLQDSYGVLKRLRFHKAVPGRYRLPKVEPHRAESYESLYRVLEELELLLKTWRRRTQHAFTAHMQRRTTKEDAADEDEAEKKEEEDNEEADSHGSLQYGADYLDNDVEHESDDYFSEDDPDHSPPPPPEERNKALTKKKYCQSTRLFHDVFASDKEFDDFLQRVRRARKHVFRVVFSLFRDHVLPVETRQRLPEEVWEKIWKLTQVPYRESPEQRFCVGTASGMASKVCAEGASASKVCADEEDEFTTRTAAEELELDRIADMFGSAGNFHMLVFEILFKHAYITQQSPLMEVESMRVNKTQRSMSYARALFQRYERFFDMHFARLQDVWDEDEEEEEAMDVANDTDKSDDLLRRVDRGVFETRSHKFDVAPARADDVHVNLPPMKLTNAILYAHAAGNVVALLEGVKSADAPETTLHVHVWNVLLDREVCRIDTSERVLDLWHEGPDQESLHTLAPAGRFALLTRNASRHQDSFKLKQWKFDPEAAECRMLGPGEEDRGADTAFVMAVNSPLGEAAFSHKSTLNLSAVGEQYVVTHQNPYTNSPVFSVWFFDCESGERLPDRELVFKDRWMSLCCMKGNRAIFTDVDAKEFLFCDTRAKPDDPAKQVLETYKFSDLCKDADHDDTVDRQFLNGCTYQAVMDPRPDRHRFAIFSQNLSCYQLFEYNDSEPAESPEVVASGSALVYGLGWRNVQRVTLYDELLVCAPSSSIHLRAHSGDFFYDDMNLQESNVFVFDLRDGSVHPVASLIQLQREYDRDQDDSTRLYLGESMLGNVLMNNYSRRIFAEPTSQTRLPPLLCTDDRTLVLPTAKSYVSLDFGLTARQVRERDGQSLLRVRQLRQQRSREFKQKEQDVLQCMSKPKKWLKNAEEPDAEQNMLRAQFVDTSIPCQGTVTYWNCSYGFLRVTEPHEAQKLKNIFLHLSDIVNREPKRKIFVKDKLEFKIVSQANNKIKACEARLLSAPKGSLAKAGAANKATQNAGAVPKAGGSAKAAAPSAGASQNDSGAEAKQSKNTKRKDKPAKNAGAAKNASQNGTSEPGSSKNATANLTGAKPKKTKTRKGAKTGAAANGVAAKKEGK